MSDSCTQLGINIGYESLTAFNGKILAQAIKP
jgi:hypothetical protein